MFVETLKHEIIEMTLLFCQTISQVYIMWSNASLRLTYSYWRRSVSLAQCMLFVFQCSIKYIVMQCNLNKSHWVTVTSVICKYWYRQRLTVLCRRQVIKVESDYMLAIWLYQSYSWSTNFCLQSLKIVTIRL